MRKNKGEIRPEFLAKNSLHSSLFGFNGQKTIVQYVPKKNKCVILLSTKHHEIKISKENDDKPEIILDYNRNKGKHSLT